MLGMLLSMVGISQSIEYPETSAGKAAKTFIEAFNEVDHTNMRSFNLEFRTVEALEKKSIDDRMAQYAQVKGMIQSLEVGEITEQNEHQILVKAFSDPLGAWFDLIFQMDPEQPTKLEKFALQPGQAPSDGEEGFGSWNSLSELLNNASEMNSIPGLSMTVIENYQIKETAVSGFRTLSKKNSIEVNDRFHLGSITKSMTASLIGRLIENGSIDESTTIGDILKRTPMKEAYKNVTIRQLLDHRGGIPAYLEVNEGIEAKILASSDKTTKQRKTFVEMVLNEEPASKPGAFAYSNAGYALLGYMAEVIAKESWEDQIEKYILSPLEMNTAGIGWPNKKDQPNGYQGSLGQLIAQDPDYQIGSYLAPAGDVNASSSDLAKYLIAHMKGLKGENTFIKAETIQLLHASKSYSGGWIINENKEGNMMHHHSGSGGTFFALMMIIPATGDGYAVAANAGDFALDPILRNIVNEYRKK